MVLAIIGKSADQRHFMLLYAGMSLLASFDYRKTIIPILLGEREVQHVAFAALLLNDDLILLELHNRTLDRLDHQH